MKKLAVLLPIGIMALLVAAFCHGEMAFDFKRPSDNSSLGTISGTDGSITTKSGASVLMPGAAKLGVGVTNPSKQVEIANALSVGGTTYLAASAESIATDAAVIGTKNVDWGVTSISSYTLTGSVTMTFSGASVGQTMTFMMTQGGTGSYTVTWPTMRWPGGTAPTLTTTVGKMDIITIFYNGNQYFGFTSGLNY